MRGLGRGSALLAVVAGPPAARAQTPANDPPRSTPARCSGPVSPKDGGHGELGAAVMLPASRLDDWKETGGHYLAIAHARSGVPVVQYIGARWTGSGDFANVSDSVRVPHPRSGPPLACRSA